jgi:hypothetical protein
MVASASCEAACCLTHAACKALLQGPWPAGIDCSCTLARLGRMCHGALSCAHDTVLACCSSAALPVAVYLRTQATCIPVAMRAMCVHHAAQGMRQCNAHIQVCKCQSLLVKRRLHAHFWLANCNQWLSQADELRFDTYEALKASRRVHKR